MRILLFSLLALAPSCAEGPVDTVGVTTPDGVRTIDVRGLKADLDAGRVAVLVDVRTPEEYAAGHVPGAVNIPLDVLDERIAELDAYEDRDVHVICESGRRSLAASQTLAAAGRRPVNVDGGTKAWRARWAVVEAGE
jgi:rhodanese-related sulfurtransferase